MTVHTVPGTGHHVHLDEPQIVADLIRSAWEP
jgi:pimeloyl-ACP methyl ester carboxylesterase